MRSTLIILCITLLSGCATMTSGDADRRLTVGTVQREVYIGMSGAEVAEVLGSPNIVTTDEYRNETWIYDKIASESVTTDTRGSVAILRFISDIGPMAASSRAQRASSSQRTLTVIIKFDEFGEVSDFAYHTSRF